MAGTVLEKTVMITILVLGLVGNAAGGLQCQIMGNEHPIRLAELKNFIKAVLA